MPFCTRENFETVTKMLQIQRQRPSMRIVISSATADVDKLALFFAQPDRASTFAGNASKWDSETRSDGHSGEDLPSGEPAVLSVQGRVYSVQEHYLKVRCSYSSVSKTYVVIGTLETLVSVVVLEYRLCV
jgi:HrpA-like RNA helicase